MWEAYQGIIRSNPRLSFLEERQLILKAQKGSKKSKDRLVLSHISFLIFRIHKVAFPRLISRFGEDLLAEAILIVYKKIESYDLGYRDERGGLNPVRLSSYLWKRIDGSILDFLKKENKEIAYGNEFFANVTSRLGDIV